MINEIVRKTLRVPRSDGAPGDGTTVARQMDAVLIGVGFAPSRELMDHVGGLEPGAAIDLAAAVVGAVRRLVGDHVQHNAYFINFPRGVPDTIDFWADRLRAALIPAVAAMRADGLHIDVDDAALRTVVAAGGVNLLALPGYGAYQHDYADLLAAHDELIAAAGDRVTVLHLGDTLAAETARLYGDLLGSTVPLGEDDAALLARLAADPAVPAPDVTIPMRETLAIVNAARLRAGRLLAPVASVTDVLRAVVAFNDGDVTLSEPTRFGRMTRDQRRAVTAALHDVVSGDPGKLADVPRLAERWKRLGRVVHPREFPMLDAAFLVFDVASGRRPVRSPASLAEEAVRDGRPADAAAVLSPGALVRQLDRLLREADADDARRILVDLRAVLPSVSGRVLLSLREHVQNRTEPTGSRVFVGRTRRAWVTEDTRQPLSRKLVDNLTATLDAEIGRRLPDVDGVVVDPTMLDVALPLSGRATEAGFAVLPRGSRARIDPAAGDTVRLFVYWREAGRRTDYDLSAALLADDLTAAGHVSWTSYHAQGLTYSGDLTSAHEGATEFIDVRLDEVAPHVAIIIPQVHIYAGEGFDEVAESMFGWMVRGAEQEGVPFEARTVRTRSDMRGTGMVACPMALVRDGRGGWEVVWLHLYLKGRPEFNRVEGNRATATTLAAGILGRRYLTVRYLVGLMAARGAEVSTWPDDGTGADTRGLLMTLTDPTRFEDPSSGPPPRVYGLDRLAALIPA